MFEQLKPTPRELHRFRVAWADFVRHWLKRPLNKVRRVPNTTLEIASVTHRRHARRRY